MKQIIWLKGVSEIAMKWPKKHRFEIVVSAIALSTIVFLIICLFFPFGNILRTNDHEDDFVVAIFTIILGAAAVIQGLYLVRQDKRLKESIEDSKAANGTAQNAVNAALQANVIAENTAKKQLRAYLSIEPVEKQNIIRGQAGGTIGNTNFNFTCNFKLANNGQTPAKDTEIHLTSFFNTGADLGQLAFEAIQSGVFEDMKHRGVLNANSSITLNISSRDYQCDSRVPIRLGCVICVKYKDMFDEDHKTTITIQSQNVLNGLDQAIINKGCIID